MKVNQETILSCDKAVNLFLDKLESVEIINIASADGFEIFTYDKQNNENDKNFSAMSGSIIALINSLLKELEFPNSDLLEINVKNGHIVLAPIILNNIDVVILIKFSNKSSKGEILYYLNEFLNNLKNIK